jgi:catechol 2,3-dioxygenase-like lactoylglutathione lyase family enzyme
MLIFHSLPRAARRMLTRQLLAMPAGKESDARKFYRDILGIPEAKKLPELAARGGCWFEDGELKGSPRLREEFRAGAKGASGLHRRRSGGIDRGSNKCRVCHHPRQAAGGLRPDFCR